MRRIVATLALLATVTLVFVAQGAGGSGGTYEVRGIFDNGDFLVTGEDVRIAGARVGSVSAVDVTMPGDWANRDESPDPGKAVVVMDITDPGFQDFRQDASCIIRPASLLGEKYIDCEPTQPRAPGTEPPAPLKVIPEGQAGAGERFLPLQNNGKAIDIDLVNNIMKEPFADRFRLILNDLGASLAARGKDLEAIVKRADPALRETDRLLAQLAHQNHELAQLAKNSDEVLAPLAREREKVAGFIRNANAAGEATAERSAALEAGFEKFPAALRALRRQMIALKRFADQAGPTFADFANAAPSLTRSTEALGPFANASIPALTSLGKAGQESVQPLNDADPILVKVRNLAEKAGPGATSLNKLLSTLRKTGGDKQLMNLFFNDAGATNGFDKFGHFLRATLVINPSCTKLVDLIVLSCAANWRSQSSLSKSAAASALTTLPGSTTDAGAVPSTSSGPLPLDAQGDAAGGVSPPSSPASPKGRVGSFGAARDLLDTVIDKPGQVRGGSAQAHYTTPDQGGGTAP